MTLTLTLIAWGIAITILYLSCAFCFWLWGLGMGFYKNTKDKLLGIFTSLLWLPVLIWPKKFRHGSED